MHCQICSAESGVGWEIVSQPRPSHSQHTSASDTGKCIKIQSINPCPAEMFVSIFHSFKFEFLTQYLF